MRPASHPSATTLLADDDPLHLLPSPPYAALNHQAAFPSSPPSGQHPDSVHIGDGEWHMLTLTTFPDAMPGFAVFLDGVLKVGMSHGGVEGGSPFVWMVSSEWMILSENPIHTEGRECMVVPPLQIQPHCSRDKGSHGNLLDLRHTPPRNPPLPITHHRVWTARSAPRDASESDLPIIPLPSPHLQVVVNSFSIMQHLHAPSAVPSSPPAPHPPSIPQRAWSTRSAPATRRPTPVTPRSK